MKQYQKTKKALSIFMVVLLLLTSVPFAAFSMDIGSKAKVHKDGYIPGFSYNFTGEGKNFGLPHRDAAGQYDKLSFGGRVAYCIECGEKAQVRDGTIIKLVDLQTPASNMTVDEKAMYIKYTLMYGYNGKTMYGYSADVERAATQAMVWLITTGNVNAKGVSDACMFDSNSLSLTANEKTFLDRAFKTSTYGKQDANLKKQALDVCEKIKYQVTTHDKLPSFVRNSLAEAQTITLHYNSSNGLYEANVKDTNGVLDGYALPKNSGVNYSKNGNVLKISTSNPILTPTGVYTERVSNKFSSPPFLAVGSYENPQNGCTQIDQKDPIYGVFKIVTDALGTLKIVKTAEDGKINNVKLNISGNGVNKDVYTGADGTISVPNLKPGTYTISEYVEGFYKPQNAQNVTIVPAQTSTVTFNNTLKRGKVTVTKTAEDGVVSGRKFHLTGKSDSGLAVDTYAVTNAKGEAYFDNILVGSNYKIEEVGTPNYYIVPAGQSLNVTWNGTTNVNFSNQLKKGRITVYKTAEDGVVSGRKFHLTGTSDSGLAVDAYATTNAKGEAYFNNILIGSNYKIEEVGTPNYYIVPAGQTLNVTWNSTTNVNFSNMLKKGKIVVHKTAEDRILSGHEFKLTGISDSGIAVDMTVKTNANGIATFNNVLIGKNYKLEEIKTGIQYVVPDSQFADIYWEKTTDKDFENILKKFTVQVQKKDATQNAAQGDGTLQGAVYGIYKGDSLIDTYTTDKNGKFTTKEYVCDTDWTLKEITPSEGYLLDTQSYHIGAEPKNFTVEHNSLNLTVQEDPIRGQIAIMKHIDGSKSDYDTPEANAEFQVYLKSAGSYENARDLEKDYLTTDSEGFAITKKLPYGTYVLHQTKGVESAEFSADIEVKIVNNEQIVHRSINNVLHESYLKFVKKDKETNKIIPVANTGIQLYKPDGSLVTMKYTYPTETVIDTFYTDETGTLITPEKLPYGKNYKAVEVSAPFGYVLDATPVYFDITPDKMQDENGLIVVNIEKKNTPQKATIEIVKKGEQFTSVTENNGIYQPVFSTDFCRGAEFTITAAEDIVTPDGTVRFHAGDVVQVLKVNGGPVVSQKLYLGKYYVQETKVPYGMLLDENRYEVTLSYSNQNEQIVTSNLDLINQRQKATLELSKALENDSLFKLGMNNEMENVKFALYAAEEMTATNGQKIPKDALLEIASVSADGSLFFQTDLPVGAKVYAQEYATDEHYVLSTEKYYLSFDYADNTLDLVELYFNNTKAIENTLIRGNIFGKKVDEDDFLVCGAKFGLFAANTTDFVEENALMVSVSNEIGVFGFLNVPYGDYVIVELDSPKCFVANTNTYPVKVEENEQNVEICIKNTFVVGSLRLTKVDKLDNSILLANCAFEVYVDVDHNKQFDPEIDKLLTTVTGNENGEYILEDLRYGGYFVRETQKESDAYLLDENVYYFEVTENGKTVVVSNNTSGTFDNMPILGEVKLLKKDKLDPSLNLTGCEFTVYRDVDNNKEFDPEIDKIVGVMNQLEEGEYSLDSLRYGGYFVKETKAVSDAYLLDENTYYFEITEDGQVVTISNNENETFDNMPVLGSLIIKKIDSATGLPLANVVFKLYDEAGNLLAEDKTDEKGIVTFEELRYGKYFYQETSGLEGYTFDTEKHAIEILKDNQIIEVTVENTPIPVPEIPKTGNMLENYTKAFACLGALSATSCAAWISLSEMKKRKKK